jgi:hypothetical protein
MDTAMAAIRAESGAISTALIGLAGFAAGAAAVALLTLVGHPAAGDDAGRAPAFTAPAQSGTRSAARPEAQTADRPGRDRPKVPEGWIYDPDTPPDCSLAFTIPTCRAP